MSRRQFGDNRAPSKPGVTAGLPLTETDGEAENTVVSVREPIATAPKNGETVLLFSDEIRHGVRGCWRKTRRFVRGRWTQNEFWSCPMTHKALGMSWTEWEPLQ